jgi:hypothetical protein
MLQPWQAGPRESCRQGVTCNKLQWLLRRCRAVMSTTDAVVRPARLLPQPNKILESARCRSGVLKILAAALASAFSLSWSYDDEALMEGDDQRARSGGRPSMRHVAAADGGKVFRRRLLI